MGGTVNNGDIVVKSNRVRYKMDMDQYGFQMKRRKHYWWLLLLLLPLLLFIKCQKDIDVICRDAVDKTPLSSEKVQVTYRYHCLYEDGDWFATRDYNKTELTGSDGFANFENLPFSIYDWVFHALSRITAESGSICHRGASVTRLFHLTRKIVLDKIPRRENLRVLLLDLETGDYLPDATLLFEYFEYGKIYRDSVHTDAMGVAQIDSMLYCSKLRSITGSCHGYADTTRVDEPCNRLLVLNDSTALRLRPIKEKFSFYVKNEYTKEPIPDAICFVTLKHPGAKKQKQVRNVRTSIDGKGVAFYDNAFVLATVSIIASKVHYRDSILTGGPWTVEEFLTQDDETRTIWLRPDPYMEEFINVDSLDLKPIPGVKNIITVTHPDGRVETNVETSNSNGIFPVTAEEDATVEIVSIKDGEYETKLTPARVFKDIKDKKILLMPLMENLIFKTVREKDYSQLLSDCELYISGDRSGRLSPENSGSGRFSVKMRKAERISIVASKSGFKTNSSSVRNMNWAYLSESEARRTIPLELDLSPCDGGTNVPQQSNEMFHQRSYSMGKMTGTSSVWVDFYGFADYLTVYDGIGTDGAILVPRQSIQYKETKQFTFTQGAITVVIETSEKNSSWEYEVRCPR